LPTSITLRNLLFENGSQPSTGGAVAFHGEYSVTLDHDTFTNNQTSPGPGGRSRRLDIHRQSVTRTVKYRVAYPSNHFKVGNIKFRHLQPTLCGTVTFSVTVPGPGELNVLETAWKDNFAGPARLLNPAEGRFVFARQRVNARTAGRLFVRVQPNARGRRLLAHHRYPVVIRLWVSYTPTRGRQRDLGVYGLHLTPRRGESGSACDINVVRLN
jgi:hypothetical protein